MPSDIPQDALSPLIGGNARHGSRLEEESKNERASLGLNALDATEDSVDIDDSIEEAMDFDDFDGGAAFLLMPHERKLPIAEQRQLVQARRKTEDDDDEQRDVVGGVSLRRSAQHSNPGHRHARPLSGIGVHAQPGSMEGEGVTGSDGTSGGTNITARKDVREGGDASNQGGSGGVSQLGNTDTTAAMNAVNPATIVENRNSDDSAHAGSGGGTRIEINAAVPPESSAATASMVVAINDSKSSDTGASANGTSGGTGGGTHIEKSAATPTEAVAKTDKTAAADSISGVSNFEKSAIAALDQESAVKSERPATAAPAAESPSTATPDPAATTPAAGPTSGGTPLLNDARNPNNALFDTILQGVNALDPSKVPLTGTEAISLAGALTANITNTHGFDRANPGPANISIATNQSGDRVFAINNQNPGAANAVYTSVDVNHARSQELGVSTSQSQPPPQKPAMPPGPSQPQLDNPSPARGLN